MRLYLVTRAPETVGHDETESVVVVTSTPDQARKLAEKAEGEQDPRVWAAAAAEHIGTARPSAKVGIIHTAFNAG
jgi:hypothetical protein